MYYDEYIIKNKKWSSYTNNIKKIICLTTKEIFYSQRDASKKYNVMDGDISKCCKNKRKSAGKHPETGEPLVWMRYDEYLKTQTQEPLSLQ